MVIQRVLRRGRRERTKHLTEIKEGYLSAMLGEDDANHGTIANLDLGFRFLHGTNPFSLQFFRHGLQPVEIATDGLRDDDPPLSSQASRSAKPPPNRRAVKGGFSGSHRLKVLSLRPVPKADGWKPRCALKIKDLRRERSYQNQRLLCCENVSREPGGCPPRVVLVGITTQHIQIETTA